MSKPGRLSPGDPSSFSRPGVNASSFITLHDILMNLFYDVSDEVKVTHMDLELEISFEKKTLSGSVTLAVERVNKNAEVLVSVNDPISYQ